MSSQPPTRYENYPPEQEGAPLAGGLDDAVQPPVPVVRPYVPEIVATPVARGIGRRGMIGLAIAVPLAGIIAIMVMDQAGSTEMGPFPEDPGYSGEIPPDPQEEEPPTETEVTVGGSYSATVPAGWQYVEDDGGGIEFTKGTNRVSASSIEVPPATLAVDELEVLVKAHRLGFTGKLAAPVDHSAGDVARASMAGTGRFRGRTARLLAELWIDGTGSGLMTTRILTDPPSSAVAGEAQQMVDDMSRGF